MTRAETIESCNSDDLVTVLEMHNRKPYKIMDRKRETKKGVMAESLEELITRGELPLFRNKRFELIEMFQPNSSKFAIFYV